MLSHMFIFSMLDFDLSFSRFCIIPKFVLDEDLLPHTWNIYLCNAKWHVFIRTYVFYR